MCVISLPTLEPQAIFNFNMNPLPDLKKIAYLGPGLWVASIPFGPSISSIFFVVALLSFVISPPNKTRLLTCIKTPWFLAISLIITWTLLSVLWAPDLNHDTWSNVKKVLRLLLIPLFYLGLREPKQQMIAWHGFIIGMLITFILSLLKFKLHLNWHQDDDAGHIFYNHIITGFLGVYAAFISLYFYLEDKSRPLTYLIGFVIISIGVLVLNPGRAAYLLFPLLVLPYLWFKINPPYRWFLPIIGLIGIITLFIFSDNFQIRFHETMRDLHGLNQGKHATSIGFRVQFYQFSQILFQKHPFIGNGPGSYYYYFKLLNPVPEWPGPPNPHSQYWLILVEEGFIGMSLWIFAFYQFFRNMHGLGRAYLFLLMFNSFTDVLFYSCPGQLFLGIAGLTIMIPKGKAK
jgi:O-antigen ligase